MGLTCSNGINGINQSNKDLKRNNKLYRKELINNI